MYIPDLQLEEDGHIAVGWLNKEHPFPQRKFAPEFLAKLKQFAQGHGDSAAALGWGAMGGCRSCEFCGKALGFGSFGVPAGEKLYYAPDMIAHYVEHHSYAPPAEFIAAILESPLPGTAEYAAAAKRFRKW